MIFWGIVKCGSVLFQFSYSFNTSQQSTIQYNTVQYNTSTSARKLSRQLSRTTATTEIR